MKDFPRPPRRPGSHDSLPVVNDHGAELILQRLRETEDRLGHKMDQERVQLRAELQDKIQELEERVMHVEKAVIEARGAAVEAREAATATRRLEESVDNLSARVMSMLDRTAELASRDARQEGRLGVLEAAATSAGQSAGHAAGQEAGKDIMKRWGPIGTVLGVIVATAGSTLLQRCTGL